ncbi:MAG: hypothetical protein ACTFAL_15405 [Candidatus Electronema sp. V4]|uniref:hypothetical protein n=1 Tax=Candidatus Electronema sp. V4 TaxID=3454756 RepID=UPI0040555290
MKKIVNLLRQQGLSSSFILTFSCLIFVLLVCLFVLVLYSHSLPANSNGACATLFMVVSSSYAVGNILGFLFGIPKTIQGEKDPSKTDNVGYQVNTSLEQISDWLTKMIVGAGLVELKDIKTSLVSISAKISRDIGNTQSQSIVIASIICFMILGFFVTYLSTRLYIANALAAANAELQEDAEEDKRKASL